MPRLLAIICSGTAVLFDKMYPTPIPMRTALSFEERNVDRHSEEPCHILETVSVVRRRFVHGFLIEETCNVNFNDVCCIYCLRVD